MEDGRWEEVREKARRAVSTHFDVTRGSESIARRQALYAVPEVVCWRHSASLRPPQQQQNYASARSCGSEKIRPRGPTVTGISGC